MFQFIRYDLTEYKFTSTYERTYSGKRSSFVDGWYMSTSLWCGTFSKKRPKVYAKMMTRVRV